LHDKIFLLFVVNDFDIVLPYTFFKMSKRIIKPIKVSCPTKRYRQTELKFGPTKAGASVIQPDCSSSLLCGLSEVVGDGLHIHNVPYDGDCFLRAVIHQMSCKQQPATETAETLRRSAVLWLRSNPAVVVDDYLDRRRYKNCDDYFARQSLPGEWVDEIMIRAVCNFLKREINIYHDNGNINVISPTPNGLECGETTSPEPPLKVRQSS
jgi:hypothetical protein